MSPPATVPPIWFYAPGVDPTLAEAVPSVEAFLKGLGAAWQFGTAFHWTLQTFLRLRPFSKHYRLTEQLPESGVLVAFSGSVPYEYRPPRGLLFVCVCADAGPHPYAHLHLVQNPTQCQVISNSHHLSHWPQFGIIPREASRGDAFVNIDFFGDEPNLHPRLRAPEWEDFLAGLGCRWRLRRSDQWHDYHETDVVVAIRSFDQDLHPKKPSSKLVNAWHAHVPAILGAESAYQSLRKGPLDYVEVRTFEEAKAAVLTLKANPELRREMARNGEQRAGEISLDPLIARWRAFLDGAVLAEFRLVQGQSFLSYGKFIARRWLAVRRNGLGVRFQRHFKPADQRASS